VDDEPNKHTLESRLNDALEKLGIASKKAVDSMKEGLGKVRTKTNEASRNLNSSEMLEKTKSGISTIGSQFSSAVEKAEVGKRATGLLVIMYNVGQRVEQFFYWMISFAPYLIPATIIFQAALWVAFLSDGSTSNTAISGIADGMDEYSQLSWMVLSIFGAVVAFLLVSNFDSSSEALDSLGNSQAYDLIVILLVVSSILFLLKSYKSLYYLSLAFIGSIIIRLAETDFSDYNWILILLSILSLLGAFSAFSLPFLRQRISLDNQNLNEEVGIPHIIAPPAILNSELSEPSYLTYSFGDIDWNMDDAPIHPPKRPSRRSEYELYEWVGLLANIILWPTTLAISMIIGSGYEIDGTALSMEDNYIMLMGPAMMTAFFFLMQYRMDSSARDGSLYAAQKQAYLDEMEKYTEARKAFLELVTLQSQIRKEQLMEENPNVNPAASES
jgi:hypothetical protein